MKLLPANKTKIVCTIGPASESRRVMEQMLLSGMNVARLNFSHGDFATHERTIETLRAASRATGRRLAIMADLSGPKIRIGQLAREPLELKAGDSFTLTTKEVLGDATRAGVSFSRLPQAVKPGDALYLNDGLIQLEVSRVARGEVHCKVIAGGTLLSRKGLNLPGMDLGIPAFTERDRECLEFALAKGVDAVSQSFVESGEDIAAVRRAAAGLGHSPFIFAKIERARALDRIDEILEAADGIMIARGDLGVEIPIAEIAVVQKHLTQRANSLGKPVITATQMLESMTTHRRPTRAEATDVANAVIDGTDGVMLSAESATGSHPVESVAMLASIAAAIEPHRREWRVPGPPKHRGADEDVSLSELIASSVQAAVDRVTPAVIIVPTDSGAMARSLSRHRLPVWIVAVSTQEATCRRLLFSYGVHPRHEAGYPDDWRAYAKKVVADHALQGELVLLTGRPSASRPGDNDRLELMNLRSGMHLPRR